MVLRRREMNCESIYVIYLYISYGSICKLRYVCYKPRQFVMIVLAHNLYTVYMVIHRYDCNIVLCHGLTLKVSLEYIIKVHLHILLPEICKRRITSSSLVDTV